LDAGAIILEKITIIYKRKAGHLIDENFWERNTCF